ncbi:hypothetical protein ACSBR1_031736 [Camellia fascicularis]
MFTTQETSYYFLPAQSAPHPHISLSLLHHDHSSNFASSFSSTPTLLTTVAAPPSLATLRLHLDRNNCGNPTPHLDHRSNCGSHHLGLRQHCEG